MTVDAGRTYAQERAAYWRREADTNRTLGCPDLVRLCEEFASAWEYDAVPAEQGESDA